MLAAEGLLVQLPNRGAQVVSLSREDVRHAFEVMAALEGLAGELAAERVTDADLAELRALQAEMEQAHARHDLPNYYRVNRAIHDRINAIAGNPVLTPQLQDAERAAAGAALPLQPGARQMGSRGGRAS